MILNPTDNKLIRKLRKGHSESFHLLYKRYAEQIYLFLYYRTQDSELAEDITQDIFCWIWINREKLDENREIRPFLYRIARHKLIDYSRKKSTTQESALHPDRTVYATDPEPVELSITLEKAIEALPEKVRTVFLLSRFQGLSYREIAESCEISVKTVENRISRALTHLRELLC